MCGPQEASYYRKIITEHEHREFTLTLNVNMC